jgi:hypothetical protein
MSVRVSVRRLVAVAGVLVVVGAIAWPPSTAAFGTQLNPPVVWPGSYDNGAFAGVTLRFRPAALPLQLSQRPLIASLRTVVDNSTAQSIWSVSPVDAPDTALTLTVHRMTVADQAPGISGIPVQVNGEPGLYHPGQGRTAVDWRFDGAFVGTLEEIGLHLAEGDLLAMAESVHAERVPAATPILRLPKVQWANSELTGDVTGNWMIRVYVAPEGSAEGDVGAPVLLEIGTGTDAPDGGQAMSVGGRPARLVGATKVKYLVVDLGGGQQATVIGSGDLGAWPSRVSAICPPDLTWISP